MLGRAVLRSVSNRIRGIARFFFPRKKDRLVVCRDCWLVMDECDGVKVGDVWFCQKCVTKRVIAETNKFFDRKIRKLYFTRRF